MAARYPHSVSVNQEQENQYKELRDLPGPKITNTDLFMKGVGFYTEERRKGLRVESGRRRQAHA